MTVQGVLFDVDGTLVDSTYLHTVAWWQAFRRAQLDVPMSRLHRAIGMGADQLVPHVLGHEVDDELQGELANGHDAIYSISWPALRAFEGARELIRRVHESGATTVLASSAGEDEVAVVRRVLDADRWLDEGTSSSDAEQSKPAPDLVGVALRKSGLDVQRSVFVGDAVWDVEASAKAGLRCIGLECGGTSTAELHDAGAVAVYADPTDLLQQWDTSLLG